MNRQLRILATTDLHGLFYRGQQTPRPLFGSLAGVREYFSATQSIKTDSDILLLDAGDFIGGGLPAYLANNCPDLLSEPHLPARLAGEIGYSAMAPGNHDIDAGPEALARYASTLPCPLLAANIIGIPFLKPYTILTTPSGLTVAIVGLVTDTDTSLAAFSGARLISMEEGAQSAIQAIKHSPVKPDCIIALVHDGPDRCAHLVEAVSDFDLILCGHVHKASGISRAGRSLIVNPGPYALQIADIDITISSDRKNITAAVNPLPMVSDLMPPCIAAYGDTVICHDAMPLTNLLHRAILTATNADISIVEASDTILPEDITMADSFRFLPYDDHIITIRPDTKTLKSILKSTSPLSISATTPHIEPNRIIAMTHHLYTSLQIATPIHSYIDKPLRYFFHL